MYVRKHTIGAQNRDRALWARDPDRYAVVREAARAGKLIEPSIRLNPSGTISQLERAYLAEAEVGLSRLQSDGLRPRLGIPYRTDILTGPVVADFPYQIVMPVTDPVDHANRFFTQVAQHGFPEVANGLGNVVPLDGVLGECVKRNGVAPVTYWGDQGAQSAIWAILLNPEHPFYLLWIAVAAQRLLGIIQREFPGLSGVELVLTSKDRHYERDAEGRMVWPLLGEWREGHSSGLSGEPAKSDPVAVRVATRNAIRMAGIRAIPDVWADPGQRHRYAEALGGEWTQ